MHKALALATLFIILAQPVLADEVVFNNGERLIGTVVKLEGGKLTFKSEMLGEQTFDLAKIKTFTTDAPVDLHLADGTVLKSKTQLTESGQVSLEGTDLIKAQQIDLDKIQAINPPPKPDPKWTGSFKVGLTSTHGNTFEESGSFSFDGSKREEDRRTKFDTLYVYSRIKDDTTGDKRTTEESFILKGKRDYFVSEKHYYYLNGSFKKDHIADLERRVILGAGSGYQWVEEDKIKFNTDAGLAYRHEKYDTRIPNPTPPPAMIQEIETSDDLSAQLGYDLFWIFRENWKFLHDTTYYPSLETVSDYFLTSTAELRHQHSNSMFSSLKAILDYDSTPAEGTSSTDTKYILSLGWNY